MTPPRPGSGRSAKRSSRDDRGRRAQVRNAHSGAALTAASSFFPLSSFPIPPKLLLSSLPLTLNASASVVGSLLALSRASANNFEDSLRPATNMALILAPFGLDGA